MYPASSVAGDTPYAHTSYTPYAPSKVSESHYSVAAPPATPASVVISPSGTSQTMVISHDGEGYAPVYGVPASPGSDEEVAEHYPVRRSQLPSY